MTNQGLIVQKSPIGFDSAKVQQITDILNPDLATLFQLFELWQKHQWYVRGSEYKELHSCFDAWAEHSLQHADTVAERIVTVGGNPLDPTAFPQASVFQFEPAGVPAVREMLQNQLDALNQMFQKLRSDIPQLDQIGDPASAILLRNILLEHERFAKKISLYLEKAGIVYELMQGRP